MTLAICGAASAFSRGRSCAPFRIVTTLKETETPRRAAQPSGNTALSLPDGSPYGRIHPHLPFFSRRAGEEGFWARLVRSSIPMGVSGWYLLDPPTRPLWNWGCAPNPAQRGRPSLHSPGRRSALCANPPSSSVLFPPCGRRGILGKAGPFFNPDGRIWLVSVGPAHPPVVEFGAAPQTPRREGDPLCTLPVGGPPCVRIHLPSILLPHAGEVGG